MKFNINETEELKKWKLIKKEEFNKWKLIKKCPICEKEYSLKCITKYKKSCAFCNHTIKYNLKFPLNYELINKFKRFRK